ncbi:Lipid transfer-like protein [Melia azedarach]|uniref:Lipid transfer-like protein n=1 Tax=Melia azedarach TaxID=155640 RepID=A0ACC1Z0U6_MELAZ|nr:Lipid transfer-like protein [Melia azedarach]
MIMKKKLISSSYGIIVLVVLLVRLDVSMGGQSSSSSCLNQLAPCLRYLNGSQDVPDSCCDPLKSVIKSNPECMCSMISNQGSRRAEQAGINVTEAQQLPGKCGQHVNPLVCLSRSPNSKDSVDQDSSAGALLFQCSQSLMVALVLSMTSAVIHILCVSN